MPFREPHFQVTLYLLVFYPCSPLNASLCLITLQAKYGVPGLGLRSLTTGNFFSWMNLHHLGLLIRQGPLGLSFKSYKVDNLQPSCFPWYQGQLKKKMMFFSCKNRLFANYDIGGNEFCTVYAAGIGIRCFFPLYLGRLSFCWSTCTPWIGFLIGVKL